MGEIVGEFWLVGGWVFVWLVACFTPYFYTDQVIPWRLVKLISTPDLPVFIFLLGKELTA